MFASRAFYLAGGFEPCEPQTIPVRCVKEPNWVHCQELRRRKKRSGLSIPGQGTRGSGELPGRPGCNDGCGGSFPLHEEPARALILFPVPSTVRIPGRIHCSMSQLVPGCSCKVPAFWTPLAASPNCSCVCCRNSSSDYRPGTFPKWCGSRSLGVRPNPTLVLETPFYQARMAVVFEEKQGPILHGYAPVGLLPVYPEWFPPLTHIVAGTLSAFHIRTVFL